MTTNETSVVLHHTPTTQIVAIPLEELGIAHAHLVRQIDVSYVADLVATDEEEWEPIEIRLWPPNWEKPSPSVIYHVVSGNHRTQAASAKGLGTVRARIIEAEDDMSYMVAAIRTNARHGRNFTEDERKSNAARLKGMGMSSPDIGKLFGVTRMTVNNWLSGRDSNASKKKQQQQLQQEVKSNFSAELIDEEWSAIPDVPVSEREVYAARRQIANFLAETPVGVEKAHVLAWVRSLARGMRQSQAEDMKETCRWLYNVVALLESEAL